MPFRTVLAAIMVLACWMAGAVAEPRIALVIGNGAYQSVPPLDNPVADANLMATTLRSVGFEVRLLTDADQSGMKRGIVDFGRDLRSAGPDAVGLFYYAGHGVQAHESNYLLPVDSVIQDEADLDVIGVEASWVLRQLHSARNRTSIIILDACRNNPFADKGDFASQGLAEMKAPTGSFLAYATSPGNVALDGTGTNSPFTEALAAEIPSAGRPIEQLFKAVRVKVLERTQGAQTPWDSSSLTADFVFKPEAPLSAEELEALQLWNSVKEAGDPVQIMLFLRAFPESSFDAEARALLNRAMAAELLPGIAPEQAASSGGAAAPAVTAVAPPAAEPPGAQETALIEAAQSSGLLADYEAYAAAYPDGVFADLARSEIENLRQKASQSATAAPAAASIAQGPAEPEHGAAEIAFLSPLTQGEPHLLGRSLADIIEGTPMFPPVEGLPESYWKDQKCSSCHEWTKEALCEQGAFYASLNGSRALSKEHPLGVTFKQTLRDWAASGCQ